MSYTNIFNNSNTKIAAIALGAILFFGAIAFTLPVQTFAQQESKEATKGGKEATTVTETTKPEPSVQPEPTPATEEPKAEAEPEVGHQVDQDLDCEDYDKTNFPASEADERYGLDPDGNGIACETEVVVAPNGTETEVVVSPAPEEDNTSQQIDSLKAQIIAQAELAKAAAALGDSDDALAHTMNAITLSIQLEALQPAATPPEPEPEVVPEEPATNETIVEVIVELPPEVAEEIGNETITVEPENVTVTVPEPAEIDTGNAFATLEQLTGGPGELITEDCFAQLEKLAIAIYQSVIIVQAQQEENNQEVVAEIEENPEVIEQAMNETGATQEVAEAAGEAVTSVIAGEATPAEASEEFVETVEEQAEENSPEIEEVIVELE